MESWSFKSGTFTINKYRQTIYKPSYLQKMKKILGQLLFWRRDAEIVHSLIKGISTLKKADRSHRTKLIVKTNSEPMILSFNTTFFQPKYMPLPWPKQSTYKIFCCSLILGGQNFRWKLAKRYSIEKKHQ